ncbi:MAG: hypothetical protein GC183_16620 [Thiobacillus sp.]|nr:hypothetical protein [Thiobacillus sp.]
MTQDKPANELNRLNGALEVLGLLREKLMLQRDELGAESAQEAVDEMRSQVDALQIECQQRRANLHPHHKSYQFVLTDEEVLPVRHDCYVKLLRGEAELSEFKGQTLRLADWYMFMQDDKPQEVVNETYNWLALDEFGRADLHAARDIQASPLPTTRERKEIYRRLFSQAL